MKIVDLSINTYIHVYVNIIFAILDGGNFGTMGIGGVVFVHGLD